MRVIRCTGYIRLLMSEYKAVNQYVSRRFSLFKLVWKSISSFVR